MQRRQGPVQLGPSWRHADAMSWFWFGQRLRFVGPCIQIGWLGRLRCFLVFSFFRLSCLRLKLIESYLVGRVSHGSENLQLPVLPDAEGDDSHQR